jgi:hypothetical protein
MPRFGQMQTLGDSIVLRKEDSRLSLAMPAIQPYLNRKRQVVRHLYSDLSREDRCSDRRGRGRVSTNRRVMRWQTPMRATGSAARVNAPESLSTTVASRAVLWVHGWAHVAAPHQEKTLSRDYLAPILIFCIGK